MRNRFLFFTLLAPLIAWGKVVRVRPVGDSITEGGASFSNWRYPLWERQKLLEMAVRIDRPSSRVIIVPQAAGFDPARDTVADKGDLTLRVFQPAGPPPDKPRPAIIFFFGGGWIRGTPLQFYPECLHFAQKGMVAISADYRTAFTHGTTPFESVADGRSAIRWVRANAAKLDAEKIVMRIQNFIGRSIRRCRVGCWR